MSKKILAIDDDEAVRKAFALALEDEECSLTTVDCGEKGIEEVRKEKYDLIFLDLKMPGINGVETLRQIRKINSHVPVYIVTAFHKEFLEELNRVNQEGIRFELVEKPFRSQQVVTIVRGFSENLYEYQIEDPSKEQPRER